MTVREAKQIIDGLEMAEGTLKIMGALTDGDVDREMSRREMRQLVALIEAEADSNKDEAQEISELIFRLKNIVSGIDNAAEMLEKDLNLISTK